jgi:hypothetical protein
VIAATELDKSLKILTVIWGAMLVAVLIYMFVIPRYLGEAFRPSFSADAFETLRVALYIASCGVIIVARVLPKYILSGKAKFSRQSTISSHPAIQLYATAMILALSLSEAIAIFGLVLFFLGRDTASLYVLGTISIFSMLLYRPVRQDIIDAATDLEMITRRGTRT